MKKQLLFIFFIFSCANIYAQSDDLWQRSNSSSALSKKINSSDSDKLYYKLNSDFLKSKLSPATNETTQNGTVEITFPNAAGVLERFAVWESSNFEPELQAKYPEIRAYEGRGLDDKTAKIHFSVSPAGVQTMVLRPDKSTEFIETNPDNPAEYVLFAKNSTTSKRLLCKTDDLFLDKNLSGKTAKTASNTKVFKTMRLALSCTAEYTTFFGGTKAAALAGMNATMTRVNGIFNKDLAVKLVIIANTDAVIYTDAASDPYSNASTGADGAWNQEVQTTLTNVIGNANYDIGHLFGASGGGGNAGCIGCVCTNPTVNVPLGKGSAYTSPSDSKPQGDTFDIDFVAHEFGHQLGANHTFSYDSEERTTVNVEPGSGTTIMAYAGVTVDYDIQSASDDYFAYASILQIQNTLASKSCPVNTAITNNPPTINAGEDYTIPIGTAFILTGTGSDPEGDSVTYTWEQNDNATTTSGANSIAYPTKPDGPLFRSVIPSSSTIRYMPSYSSVLQNRLTTTWESVSSIARTLHFTLTGRDNAALGTAQTNTDAMVVNVASFAGPFAITSHTNDNVSWWQGLSETVTWSVNNTNTLQGSTTVNIKLSTDGGLTFPITLAANTPNDGSETIVLPTSVPSSKNCRILIEPTGNIYYAINSKAFAVGYTSSATCDSYSFGSSFSIPNTAAFVTRTITVPDTGATVADVNVSVNVTHARFSDIEIQIVNPQGTIVRLFNKNCESTNSTLALQFDDAGAALDCNATTQQIVIPVDALSVFNGQNTQGTWTLRVRDAVTGSFGTLNSASISICGQTFTLGTSDFENIDFSLYPNPNKGNFNIQFESQGTKGVKVFVHDILGKNVYSNTFETTTQFNQNIQLQNVSSGIYLVTVIDGDRRTVKKLVVN
ncbi:T9SS type A sorting domain-containing protein [Flavobacterium sp. MR2016-29]|uniref:zinc-dependent metalloprotease n=1 Tax=Flavobacterium sp. MR2016-29 TaxID=2783795 RepID=UPI00188C3BBC|nr:zinc-dependent metalloprotease family protein [Flavobacterium sp. MR2016-29]MBF4493614.1 T9SS type A sorting domain-containing protein [Flavobacterium sp. MR2016-29]